MKKILIIDDSSFQRKIVSSILQDAGYTLLLADNGKDGITIAEKEKPDLIVSDLLMPEYDGFYLLEQAQASPAGHKILIVTSDIQHSTLEKCKKLGAVGLINKPVKKETLLPAVEKALSGERF
jgi:CheY-like chemotaxis protein